MRITLKSVRIAIIALLTGTPVFFLFQNFSFTNIGTVDLLLQNASNGTIVHWTFDGAQYQQGSGFPPSVGTLATWRLAAQADINLDGHPDFIFQNKNDSSVVYWLMQGANMIGGSAFTSLPNEYLPDWDLGAVADFDDDGRSDLIWQNRKNGQIKIWYMNYGAYAATGYAAYNLNNGLINYRLAAVTDLDGDTRVDFLFQHKVDGSVIYWLMKGNRAGGMQQYLGGGQFAGPGAGLQAWKLSAAVDINNDRSADLIFQNVNDGAINYWLMDRSAYTGGGQFSVAPPGGGAFGWSVTGGVSAPYRPMPGSLRALANARGIAFGAALKSANLANPSGPEHDPQLGKTLRREFSMLTPDHEMMFGVVHPSQNANNFTGADKMVAFAMVNDMKFRGHPLVWDTPNMETLPTWLRNGNFTPAQRREILKSHIQQLVGRYHQKYPNKIHEWVVVNEALDDPKQSNGWTAPLLQNYWSVIGSTPDEYIRLAFQWAHDADPTAILYYNDYNTDIPGTKSEASYNLVASLKQQGVPIHGVGLQSHTCPNCGTTTVAQLRQNIARYGAIGIQVSISEFDMRLPVTPTANDLSLQSQTYQTYLSACIAESACTSFATWGVSDKDSWIPQFFPGFDHALIFDRAYQPKPHIYPLLVDVMD